MDVSVIIVNYNTLGLTSDCIESIIAQTSTVEYEIILVDNASTDGSKEVFAQDKRIKYIYSDRNLGFGRANNLGIREAKGRYLFFLNSDTILLNNAVKLFFDFCEKNPDRKIGAVGAVLKDQNQKNIHSYGRFITPRGEIAEVLGKYLRFLKKRNHSVRHRYNSLPPLIISPERICSFPEWFVTNWGLLILYSSCIARR